VGSRVERFAALVQQHPKDERFRFSLAQALAVEERGGEAEAHFAFCAAKKPDWMMPRILLGKLLLVRGRADEARPILEEALQLAIEQHHEDPEHELRDLLAEIRA